MKGTKATQPNPTLVRIGEAIRKQREKTRIICVLSVELLIFIMQS